MVCKVVPTGISKTALRIILRLLKNWIISQRVQHNNTGNRQKPTTRATADIARVGG